MPEQTRASIHELIGQIFAEASQSTTPFSTIALWCVRLRETNLWTAADIDLVADTTVRMLALHHKSRAKASLVIADCGGVGS